MRKRKRGGLMDKNEIEEKIKELEERFKTAKGTPCEIYSRVVGYFRPVKNWNEGKQEEFKDRVVYEQPKEKGENK